LVRVKAAGVGLWDTLIREGRVELQPLPLILGSELSGIVEGIGADVLGFKLGDEVYGAANEQFSGAYVEYALSSARMMAPKPRSWSLSCHLFLRKHKPVMARSVLLRGGDDSAAEHDHGTLRPRKTRYGCGDGAPSGLGTKGLAASTEPDSSNSERWVQDSERWHKLWPTCATSHKRSTIDEALAKCRRDEERWWVAELLRLNAQLILIAEDTDAAARGAPSSSGLPKPDGPPRRLG
jgi:Alcohol dehydrogenase GroES-like domain